MVWRLVMRYLAQNEQLIEKLAESRLMRRAAQMTVYLTLRWKAIGENTVNNILKSQLGNKTFVSGNRIKSFSERFSSEVKAGMKSIQDDMKKKNNY